MTHIRIFFKSNWQPTEICMYLTYECKTSIFKHLNLMTNHLNELLQAKNIDILDINAVNRYSYEYIMDDYRRILMLIDCIPNIVFNEKICDFILKLCPFIISILSIIFTLKK